MVCHHRQQHTMAASICQANGARLCSVAEVKGKVTSGSGCGIDNKVMWTSTPCADGFMAARGSGLGNTQCLAKTSTKPSVRCCAE